MRNFSIILFLSLTLLGCKENIGVCDIPEDSIPAWMQDLINELEDSVAYDYTYMTSGEWQDQEVFVLRNCCPFCGSTFIVYSCSGEQLGTLDVNDINANDINNERFFWAPLGVQCAQID